jgi:hypothetical protein
MADVNMGPLLHWFDQFLDSFEFTRPGRDQSLGRDIANELVDSIDGRNSQRVDPDGAAWPPNSTKEPPKGGYKGWKKRKYGLDDEPNVRTGQMVSRLSLYGRTKIEPKLVTLVYGIDAPPDSSAAPTGYISNADKSTTDVRKAYYAHTGQGPHGTKRRFYEATNEDAVKLAELVQENLNDYIRSLT